VLAPSTAQRLPSYVNSLSPVQAAARGSGQFDNSLIDQLVEHFLFQQSSGCPTKVYCDNTMGSIPSLLSSRRAAVIFPDGYTFAAPP
jgi:hypothetical protein